MVMSMCRVFSCVVGRGCLNTVKGVLVWECSKAVLPYASRAHFIPLSFSALFQCTSHKAWSPGMQRLHLVDLWPEQRPSQGVIALNFPLRRKPSNVQLWVLSLCCLCTSKAAMLAQERGTSWQFIALPTLPFWISWCRGNSWYWSASPAQQVHCEGLLL